MLSPPKRTKVTASDEADEAEEADEEEEEADEEEEEATPPAPLSKPVKALARLCVAWVSEPSSRCSVLDYNVVFWACFMNDVCLSFVAACSHTMCGKSGAVATTGRRKWRLAGVAVPALLCVVFRLT
jgi:hypothetical protein